ncbi:hypothetical protein I6A84_29425 [Frankia sp. CNm7]|uniref:Uncharacterized protein n=1 Tax=Frankia nepalensis TaxID=1836974 RepID=A0A937URB4_9ACTN|nr:hypothetical protein [Frankia nepalensis]MBL7498090.1 hypothetical protein [Frankia nepalensis]MBL7509294.1 hypothetical protein [Frankia nepalensis]MBL7522086.1 hypothetical protein [Frankia nepalensis]MBL7629070.1 hypothetical protein [Frankia nepalensis]
MTGEEGEEKAELVLRAFERAGCPERYYALCADAGKAPGQWPDLDRQTAALTAAGLEARYDGRERFFACRTRGAQADDIGLNVAISAGIELILVWERSGGPFHRAAYLLAERAGGPLPDPPYPRVTFGSGRPFETAVAESAALFRDVRAALRELILAGDPAGNRGTPA